MKSGDESIESQLALHLVTLRYEDISDAAITATESLLLDTVAAMVASLRSSECIGLRDRWAEEEGGLGECSLIGNEHKVSAGSAAFLNGVFAHWYEWDDVHIPSILHASAVLFPVLLAAAESRALSGEKVSGQEFISTCVATFDVAARISECIVPKMHNGWMPTGNAVIGAAGGAARLLGLGADGVHSAMGIAAATMGVSRQPIKDKVNGKNVLCGIVAQSAMHAAYLAKQGISGSRGFLFGPFGAATLFADGSGSEEAALSGLRDHFSITESSVKLYPCCQSTHGCIDAALDLHSKEQDLVNKIENIELRLPQRNYELVGGQFQLGENPRVAAQFSVAFTVALALHRGAVRIDDFSDASVKNAREVINLTERTQISINDEPGHLVRLHLRDGSIRERSTTIYKGNPRLPLNDHDRNMKLNDALAIVHPANQSAQLASMVNQVNLQGIDPLMRWVRELNVASTV